MKRIFCTSLLVFVLGTSIVQAQSPGAGPFVPAMNAPHAGSGTMFSPADMSAPPAQPECIPPGPAGPRVFTLAELESLALRNNPGLAVAAARVDAARGQWQQVGLYPNPSAGYLATEIGDEKKAGQQGGYLSQEFVLGGKLGLDRAAAAQEIDRMSRELDAQRFRVVNDVRVGFYEVLIAQRRIELADELLRIGQQGVSVTEQLLRGKEATRPDLLQARVESNTARIAADNARNTHLGAWRRLAAVCGTPNLPPTPLNGQIDSDLRMLTWEESIGRLLAGSPEVAASEANVRRAEYALDRARKEPIPNVSVMLTGQYDNATGDPILGIQAGVPIPVWNRNQGGIMKADSELMAARSTVQRMQLELTHRLASTFERYANARKQVDIYVRDILPDAKMSLDMMATSYRAGEANYLMLLTVQRTYFQANLAYLDALRELRESTVDIEGMLLRESLLTREPQ